MTGFTQSQLDTMVRDADLAAKCVLGDSTLADVCVHVKALAAEVERLKNSIEAAERISDGEDVEFQQPHPRILSIVAGGRATMASQQAEIDRLKADNERLNEEAETLIGSEAMALSRVCYSAGKRHVAAEIATAWWKQRDALRAEVTRLQSIVTADCDTQPCGHAAKWLAYRDPVNPQSERYCLFCQIERLPITDDDVPVHIIPGDTIWTWNSDDLAVAELVELKVSSIRWDVDEWEVFTDAPCFGGRYSTREAAEKARSTQ